jgi:hypothetical protein
MSTTFQLTRDDLELFAAMEVVDTLRDAREALEADGHTREASGAYRTLLAAENKAATRAWAKMIKKYPGVCRYLYGGRTKKLKKDLEQFAAAAKHLDEKTAEGRKTASKILVAIIMKFSGFPDIAIGAVPWAIDAFWAAIKWEFRLYKKLFSWLGRNIDEMGDLDTLREECKRTKPELPNKVERAVNEAKRLKRKSKK